MAVKDKKENQVAAGEAAVLIKNIETNAQTIAVVKNLTPAQQLARDALVKSFYAFTNAVKTAEKKYAV